MVVNDINLSQIIARRVFGETKLPGFDYCINPYSGCPIGCEYCFASTYLKNFAGHGHDEWGNYIDLKYYESRDMSSLSGKRVVMGSVTDPYNQCEAEYHKTREVLEDLPLDVRLTISTKSDLILNDRFLLSRFPNLTVGVSICSLDANFNAYMEPGASSAERRLATLKSLHDAGISTCLVISPIFPYITDVEALLDAARGFVDSLRFESLCLNDGVIRKRVLDYINSAYPWYYSDYERIYKGNDEAYWCYLEREISELSTRYGIPFEICFDRSMRRRQVTILRHEAQQTQAVALTQTSVSVQERTETQTSAPIRENLPVQTEEMKPELPVCRSGELADVQSQEETRGVRTSSVDKFRVKTIDEMTDEELEEAAEEHEYIQMMDWIKDDPWCGRGEPY